MNDELDLESLLIHMHKTIMRTDRLKKEVKKNKFIKLSRYGVRICFEKYGHVRCAYAYVHSFQRAVFFPGIIFVVNHKHFFFKHLHTHTIHVHRFFSFSDVLHAILMHWHIIFNCSLVVRTFFFSSLPIWNWVPSTSLRVFYLFVQLFLVFFYHQFSSPSMQCNYNYL